MRKYIEFETAKKYLHEACAFIGGNGGMMLKIKFDEEPTIELTPTDIEKLQSAQSEQKWIPCSERLPKEDGRYLCTYSDFGICVDFGLYTDGQWIIEPIAWMPLPQPWKEVEDEFYNRNA